MIGALNAARIVWPIASLPHGMMPNWISFGTRSAVR
jgi:hypothetical protein